VSHKVTPDFHTSHFQEISSSWFSFLALMSNFEPIASYFDSLLDTFPQIRDIILELYFTACFQIG
jgi:hypothetical protein